MSGFEIKDNVLIACKKDDENVIIPNGVKEIGFFAFYQLDFAKSIHLPSSLTKLTSVFTNSPRLESITVDEDNLNYSSAHGILYSKDGRVLKRYPPAKAEDTVVIKEGVRAIDTCAFFGCRNVKKVILPSTITKIGSSAFSGCENLEEINLPEGIEKICPTAFNNCRRLKKVTVPSSVETIGFQAFKSCTSLKEIKIPRNVKKVEGWAFSFCRSLKTIEIESEETELEKNVFDSCYEIKNIIMPKDHNQSLNWWRLNFEPHVYFHYGFECLSRESVLVKQLTKNRRHSIDKLVEIGRADLIKPLMEKSSRLKLIDLDDLIEYAKKYDSVEVTSILLDYKRNSYTKEELEKYESDRLEKELGLKERTIAEWTKIFKIRSGGDNASINRYIGRETDVEIPESIGKYKVVEIDHCAFKTLPITSITFPKTIKRIGFNAFHSCQSLTSVDLPKGIKKIESGLFEGCTELKTVTIPNGVNTMETCAFHNCQRLEYVTIPPSVKKMGSGLFENCTELKSVTIPNGVKTIEAWTFHNCQRLEYVTIPASVKKIDECAFSGCQNLTIRAPLNSYAEEYAQDYQIKFEEI